MRRTGIKTGPRVAVEDIEPIATARGPKGRCGRCDGLIASETLNNETLNNDLIYVCRNCGREATPIECDLAEPHRLWLEITASHPVDWIGQLPLWTP